MNYSVLNILDLIDAIGEEKVKLLLSDFSCSKNTEIETFVHYRGVEFSKKNMSIMYLVINDVRELIAIFSLAHKAVDIGNDVLSNELRRKINRYAQLDEGTNSYTVSAFLIAQFGKNSNVTADSAIGGNQLMDCVFDILMKVQHQIGGGVVYLECENNHKLMKFYQSNENRFKVFGNRQSKSDDTKYIQLARFF
jgi:hypothetical protein